MIDSKAMPHRAFGVVEHQYPSPRNKTYGCAGPVQEATLMQIIALAQGAPGPT